MIAFIVFILRLVEALLLARLLLGYLQMPQLKVAEMVVRAATTPMIELVRVRMRQPASPEAATWVALILAELLRLGCVLFR
jgi:hypothetical protein